MKKLNTYINKKYLNKDVLLKLRHNFNNLDKKISYLVIDDFLNSDVYYDIEKQSKNFHVIDHRNEWFISNKTAYVSGWFFNNLFEFFQSSDFQLILKVIYWKEFTKYSHIDVNKIKNNFSIEEYGWICQLYEKWDFMSRHTDISKDMKREELIEKWWYSLWDKYEVKNYEEVWAFVYYIYNSDNDNWDESYWWNLELWKIVWNEMKTFKSIFPKKNRLVLIKSSNYSYHRVSKVLKVHYRLSFQDLLIHYKNKPDESTRHIHNWNM